MELMPFGALNEILDKGWRTWVIYIYIYRERERERDREREREREGERERERRGSAWGAPELGYKPSSFHLREPSEPADAEI